MITASSAGAFCPMSFLPRLPHSTVTHNLGFTATTFTCKIPAAPSSLSKGRRLKHQLVYPKHRRRVEMTRSKWADFPKPMKHQKVTLNSIEVLLKKLLLDCRDHNARNSSPWSKPASNLELRFTGGWVRDKLLGIESDDIDVALGSMTGAQFGEMLKDYVTSFGDKIKQDAKDAKYMDVGKLFSEVHKIKANPEQSKHLETATTRIFGLSIDFVNLRKETYTSDSRNPQVEFGTPQEDAERRDATINALFYNLDEDAVEDFTGRGIQDLASGIIRTPLAPFETFMDDPLRVLRLIRFASKYAYSIDVEVEECMANREVHEALKRKISRDRVGVEIDKMFRGKQSIPGSSGMILSYQGPNPHRAMLTIYRSGLLQVVFQGASTAETQPDVRDIPIVWTALRTFEGAQPDVLGELLLPSDQLQYPWYIAAYLPWYLPSETNHLRSIETFREAVRASNKIIDRLRAAVKDRKEVASTVERTHLNRSDVGMKIKRWGQVWRTTVLFALFHEIRLDPIKQDAIVDKYRSFAKFIKLESLADADQATPILNGRDVQNHFGLKKGGPWLGKALDAVQEWQFCDPKGSVNDAYALLEKKKEELGIP